MNDVIREKMIRESTFLLIDVQERFVPAMPTERLALVERSAKTLATLAAHVGAGVIYTEQYPRGLGPTIPSILETLRAAGAQKFEKSYFDACRDPQFSGAMASMPRRVILCGIEAHICVRSTAQSLVAAGFEVIVPHDGVASRRDEDRAVGLERMRETGVIVTTMESIVFETLECAGDETFKRFSKMIR